MNNESNVLLSEEQSCVIIKMENNFNLNYCPNKTKRIEKTEQVLNELVSQISLKNILDENEDALMDIAHKEAKVRNVGIKSAAKAVKEGLKEEDTIYCKHCGYEIDSDSKFCKKCGKEQ
jgi:hypothetical protein